MSMASFLSSDFFGTGRTFKDVLVSSAFIGGVGLAAERFGVREMIVGTAVGSASPALTSVAYYGAVAVAGQEAKEAMGM